MKTRYFSKPTLTTSLLVLGALLSATGCSTSTGSANNNDNTSTIKGSYIGDTRDTADARVKEQEEFIERQQEELRKQERELEDLKRQKYHNDYLKSRYPSLGDN
jgi:ribosomal protein L19E